MQSFFLLLVFFGLVSTAAVNKSGVHFPQLIAGNGNSLGFDGVSSISQSTFSCFASKGYSLYFARIYGPASGGQGDSTGVSNVFNANKAGLAYEAYVTPALGNSVGGGTQFSAAYSFANSQGLNLNRLWLQVTRPDLWGSNVYQNVNFIQSFINAAAASGVSVGIYTNWYDWSLITGSSTAVNPAGLWYWNANGIGTQAETVRDASDFFPFGPFRTANVKQFGIQETVCGTTVNVDLFGTGSFSANSLDMSVRSSA
ncbi:hypothetical protein M3Y99_00841200 [Aphelenchoides fujianensis]|nr:hypothetical protein M3Y99_01724700 [Aphelenchoides fujianensis]KAI6234076.1 hypothetical protein M3Y99_00841200 [Aphelenchoides fujianensis]